MFTEDDRKFMREALTLAERGLYTTTPNPRVGAVIVQDGVVIGSGYTQPPGGNHAEIEALRDARARNAQLRGATMYVTLEPCNHFGRTPPCVNALIDAGIGRVIAAMEDPNPLVSGNGLRRLRDAGVEVRCGLLEREAGELNIGFVSRMTRRRPWVRLKTAASLDGGTALRNGQSQWITSAAARHDGHAWRARACALLTGVGTVRADNPRLNVRDIDTPRQPLRVLVDSRLEIDLQTHLVKAGNLLVACAVHNPDKERELAERGCEVVHLPNADGKVDLPGLLAELAERGINELHGEAGGKLNGSLIREGCADELLIYLAPSLLGPSQPMFALPELEDLEQRHQLRFHQIDRIGEDLRILARFDRPPIVERTLAVSET